MTPEQNAATANYVFDPEQVRSFLDADLFGAPLSATLAGSPGAAVAVVSIALMLIAAVATHLTARIAVARQDSDTPQARVMNSMTLWVFPAGVLVGGALLPVVILLYWVTNNAWTVAQQFLIYRKVDAEFATAPPPVVRTATAPKPGVKPRRARRRR
ncbi:YidC/Oxa1 family membrane protein insertase [Nocardia takedensis]|uniref:YidC/Oxa1 family membrane protein insertase n=1 Tax=Nocardia takedensis TaxID=259390 RepID=UPI0002E65025